MRTRPEITTTLKVGTQLVRRDEAGFLMAPEQWDEAVGDIIAAEENITLSEEHRAVIKFIRDYLDRHGIVVDARFTFAFLAKRNNQNKSQARRHFFELFPYGYVKQACKIAGMRQPRAWSTG